MTSGSSNFNTFPENQLTTFRAVQAQYYEILHCCDRSAGTVSSFSQKCQYAVPARTALFVIVWNVMACRFSCELIYSVFREEDSYVVLC